MTTNPTPHSPSETFEQAYILPALNRRRERGSLRKLVPFHTSEVVDFSSNDYLGLAQNLDQHAQVQRAYEKLSQRIHLVGSTGSRLLTGDSEYAHHLEEQLAQWHSRPAALLCNSGYDANLAVLSSVTRHSIVLLDELCHNSLYMGIQLGKGSQKIFRHNNTQDLEGLLQQNTSQENCKQVFIVVESVYSMDGDVGPLQEILELALRFRACVIVDEAHGLGVFGSNGMGVLAALRLENHPALLCSIHTFGKAAGCHGAVVCGSIAMKEYLINYGRPIVYSTSLPLHSLVCIACAYESMRGEVGRRLRAELYEIVEVFRKGMLKLMAMTGDDSVALVPSYSAVQALIIPGNKACVDFCELLWLRSGQRMRLYPIRSPTVPIGQERVRIIVHSHNTKEQVEELLYLIKCTMQDMGYLPKDPDGSFRSRM